MVNGEALLRVSHIEINGRKIGPGFGVYIVAELSANHRQRFDEAVELVKTAKDIGADAVKLQTFTPDTITIQHDAPEFRVSAGTVLDGRTLYDLYSEAYMPWEWQPKLKKIANDLGIDLFSTPFDKTAVDFLEGMDMPAYKVASPEIVDIPLIEYIASKGKPLIISTGMAKLDEIDEAIRVAQSAGAEQIALLKCTSSYPALPEEMNLRAIPYFGERFRVPVGLSDHTLEIAVPAAAVALGACIIEKHLTLSRSNPSPDSSFSLQPDEFKTTVDMIRTIESALGEVEYQPSEREARVRAYRRSLFVVKDMKAGEVFTVENVRSIRPGNGLHPRYLKDVLGHKARRDISRGTPLSWESVALDLGNNARSY